MLSARTGRAAMSSEPASRFDAADEALLLEAIDRWIERDLKPIVKEYDHADRYPEHIVEQMKELGLCRSPASSTRT